MRIYTLIIKGSPQEACDALVNHDFGGALLSHKTSMGEIVAKLACKEENAGNIVNRLNQWFIEDSNRDAPYPAGSLLLWTPGEDSEMQTFRRTQEQEASA